MFLWTRTMPFELAKTSQLKVGKFFQKKIAAFIANRFLWTFFWCSFDNNSEGFSQWNRTFCMVIQKIDSNRMLFWSIRNEKKKVWN